MHELMRENLRDTLIKENLNLHEHIHELLFDYYENFLEEQDMYDLNPVNKKAILEAYYHGRNSISFTDFSSRFLRLINPLVIQPKNFSFIKSLLYSVLDSLDLSDPSHRVIKFHILFLLITGLNSNHKLKESAKLLIRETKKFSYP